MNDKSLPELEYVNEQRKRHHESRVNDIRPYLKDKLSRFPDQGNPSEFETLYQEAQKLLRNLTARIYYPY